MILKFPDFSLTFVDFLISLTILQNSLTFPWPWRKTKFPWLFPDGWAPWILVQISWKSQSYQASIKCWAIIGLPASDITFWIRAWLYFWKSCIFEKIYISVFSISTPVTLRMQKASSRFLLHNFPWWVPLSIGITWDLFVMKQGPTVELRRLNPSLFMLLKFEWALGEQKSLGLNWNRQNLYIRNGMNCNNTCPRCT